MFAMNSSENRGFTGALDVLLPVLLPCILRLLKQVLFLSKSDQYNSYVILHWLFFLYWFWSP